MGSSREIISARACAHGIFALSSTEKKFATRPLRERRDTMRATKMSGKGVLFTHLSPARSTPKSGQYLTSHTGLRGGVFSKVGNMHMRTLNITECGERGGGVYLSIVLPCIDVPDFPVVIDTGQLTRLERLSRSRPWPTSVVLSNND